MTSFFLFFVAMAGESGYDRMLTVFSPEGRL